MRLTARKKRKILVLTALIAALALGVYLLLANAVFIVRDVRVEGNVNIDSDSIIRAAQLPLGKPMREVSEEKARAALESGGLVELVGLEKRYPDQVVLNVRERECEAVVSYAGVILTMERDGTVIEQLDALPETDAVYVTGLTVTAFRPGEVISAPASQLEAMVLDARGAVRKRRHRLCLGTQCLRPNDIYLYSRTGMRVDLGNRENMGNKVVWMVGALRDLESRGETTGGWTFPAATKPITAPIDGDLSRSAAASPRSCDGFAPIF